MMNWKTSVVAAVALTACVAQAQLAKEPAQAPVSTQTVANDQKSARRITRDQAIEKVHARTAIFVDVRAKDQYEISHIKGAINIPLTELIARMKELPKNKMIVTYCA